MGIMSKNNRLPERPKPPSWAEITNDVEGAQSDDVVFVIGNENLAATCASMPVSSSEKSVNASNSSLNSSGMDTSDLDSSQLDLEKVQASYADVVKLVTMYSELKDAPQRLQEHFSQLKDMGEGMNKSIDELKSLSQSIGADATNFSQKKDSPGNTGSASNKGKPKQKKKK